MHGLVATDQAPEEEKHWIYELPRTGQPPPTDRLNLGIRVKVQSPGFRPPRPTLPFQKQKGNVQNCYISVPSYPQVKSHPRLENISGAGVPSTSPQHLHTPQLFVNPCLQASYHSATPPVTPKPSGIVGHSLPSPGTLLTASSLAPAPLK